ncbi:MAG: serine hydrolase [Flavobacteriaceae bacterium]|nr:serine hydrolase [Flavobacteriaceae bacterium]
MLCSKKQFAAGSIMSTTDDLLKWQNAINTNILITRKSLEKAINGSTLNNGEEIAYGYGWGKDKVQELPAIAHGGGIFGYTTHEMYMPDENIYVVTLTNCNCKNISGLTKKNVALAIGKPYPNKKDAISLSTAKLQKWVGAYQFDNEVVCHIILKDSQLYSLREGGNGEKYEIYPLTENRFIFESGDIEYLFSTTNEGKNQTIFKVRGKEFIRKPIDKPLPTAKKEIQLSTDILKQYIGKYELQPGFILDVTVKGNKIYTQATGQPKFEMFAESEDHFFLKVVPESIEFTKNDKGIVDVFILTQGGQIIPAKKI